MYSDDGTEIIDDPETIKFQISPSYLLNGAAKLILRDFNGKDFCTLQVKEMTEDGVLICKPITEDVDVVKADVDIVKAIERLDYIVVVDRCWSKLSPETQRIMDGMGLSLQDFIRGCLRGCFK